MDAVSWVLQRWEGSAHTSWPAVICWQLADGAAVLSLDVREAQDLEAIRTRATTPVAAICRADLDAAAAAGGHPFPGLSEAQCVELRLYFRQDGTLSEVEQTLEAEAFVALWEMGSGKADLRQIRRVDGETWQAPEGTLTVN